MEYKVGDKVRFLKGCGWSWEDCPFSQSYGIVKGMGFGTVDLQIYMNNGQLHSAFRTDYWTFKLSSIKKE